MRRSPATRRHGSGHRRQWSPDRMTRIGRSRRARQSATASAAVLAIVAALSHLGGPPVRAASLLAVGTNDTYSVSHDRTLAVAAPGVLGNDLNVLGSTTAVRDSYPSHGTLTLRSNGSFTYVPNVGYVGNDSFRYHPSALIPTPATVTIRVTNATPVARPDAYSGVARTTLVVAAPGVLANDTDADGDTLRAELDGGGISGSLDLAPNGGFTYSPGGGVSGTVSFSYRVWDGVAWSSPTTVTLTITSAPTPTPTPTPRPTPTPTPRPTSTPRPTPTPVPLASVPLPSIPLPSLSVPSLPVSSLLPNPSAPAPSASSSAPPRASTQPSANAGEPSPSPGNSATGGIGSAPSGGGGAGIGPGSGPDGDGQTGGGLRLEYGNRGPLDLGSSLGDVVGSFDTWAVPAATIGASGLLVILFVALQAGGTLIWVPAMRRLRGERRVRGPRTSR
jgi:hypothetical protein